MSIGYFIEKRAPVDGLSLSARTMYQGEAHRPGAPYPLYSYRVEERHELPLHVTRNVHIQGDVCEPHCAWIVSDRARAALSGVPKVAFLPVHWEKVFDAPYAISEEPFPDLEDDSELWSFFEHDLAVASVVSAK